MIKNQIIGLSNYIKNRAFTHAFRHSRKKAKIIFYKKINKLFFRAGRSLFINLFGKKKKYTQTFVSKRIVNVIKNNWIKRIEADQLTTVILSSNIFFTHVDSNLFIKNFGVIIDKNIIYDPSYKLTNFKTFSFNFYKYILIFFLKKRRAIIFNLKNIKFYKFRSKIFRSAFNSNWIPSIEWIQEHSFLYFYKSSNIEFDLRTLTGVLIYQSNRRQSYRFFNNMNISLFMARSYTWKYIV